MNDIIRLLKERLVNNTKEIDKLKSVINPKSWLKSSLLHLKIRDLEEENLSINKVFKILKLQPSSESVTLRTNEGKEKTCFHPTVVSVRLAYKCTECGEIFESE
jgi:hypothetical protein